MKRLILLTAALLGASYCLRTPADTRPQAVAGGRATSGDGSCCATGEVSRASLIAAARSKIAAEFEDQDEVACSAAAEPAEAAEGFPDTEMPVVPAASTRGVAYVVSDLKAVPERAEVDAYAKLQQATMGWLVPDVPANWRPPVELLRSLVVDSRSRQFEHEYAPVYQMALKVDLSPKNRQVFQNAYLKDEGLKRMGWLGAVVAFVLAILAILAGYIRTDEATKGYYTARLRMLAAAGVGAAGVVLYEVLT